MRDLAVDFGQRRVLDVPGPLEVSPGDIVAVIGPNGAGKTTFINCITRQIDYSGTIERGDAFARLGILLQENRYSPLMKVKELMGIVAQKSLRCAEMKDLILEFELGSILNSRLGKISKGESQRLTLALLVYQNPDLLIFDELTTGLDYDKRVKLLRLVRNISSGKTAITVTHYFEELFDWANKILLLNGGETLFWGGKQEFENMNPHYSVMLFRDEYTNAFRRTCQRSEVVESYEDGFNAIISANSEDEHKLSALMSEDRIPFEIRPKSLYSAYRLALAFKEREN